MHSEFSSLMMNKMPHRMAGRMWDPQKSPLNFNFQWLCMACLNSSVLLTFSQEEESMHRATPVSQSWDLCSHSVFFTIEEIFHTLLIFLMPLTCPQSCNYLCCHQWILDLVVEPYDFSSLLPFLSLCFSVSCSLISCCQTLKSDRKKKKVIVRMTI